MPESFSPEDPNDERILQYALCEDCILRSKKCLGCQFQNSQASMQQLLELRMIRDSVCVQKDETGIATLVCNYPVMGDAKTLYRKELSNSHLALKKSQTLFSRLGNRNLIIPFHAENVKSIGEGHMRVLSS